MTDQALEHVFLTYQEGHTLVIKRVEGVGISGVLFTDDPIKVGDFITVPDWSGELPELRYRIVDLYAFRHPKNMYQYQAVSARDTNA